MARYRLSPLRSTGWRRAGLVGSFATLPLAMIAYSLGFFSDGMAGIEQAGEFVLGGILLAQMIGQSAAWILRGFAQRTAEDEQEGDEADRRPGRSSPQEQAGPGRSRRQPAQRALPRGAAAGAGYGQN